MRPRPLVVSRPARGDSGRHGRGPDLPASHLAVQPEPGLRTYWPSTSRSALHVGRRLVGGGDRNVAAATDVPQGSSVTHFPQIAGKTSADPGRIPAMTLGGLLYIAAIVLLLLGGLVLVFDWSGVDTALALDSFGLAALAAAGTPWTGRTL